jgi:hypothetical protein
VTSAPVGLCALAAWLFCLACSKRADAPPAPPPTGSGSARANEPDLPASTTIDWQNLFYDLGSLGVVRAVDGRATFHVIEVDDRLVAVQDPAFYAFDDWPGFLDLDPPKFVDLDGDKHDEAAIPFELKSAKDDDTPNVFGLFVFTLRDGLPVKLATITTTKKLGFTVVGSTIETSEGAVWSWDPQHKKLVDR